MNAIIKTFLLAVDKFMPQIDLRQPIFTYNACGSFTKNKERIKKNKRFKISLPKWTSLLWRF